MKRKCLSILLAITLALAAGTSAGAEEMPIFEDGEIQAEEADVFTDSAAEPGEARKEVTIDGVFYFKYDEESYYSASIFGVNVEVKDYIDGLPVRWIECADKCLETIKIPDTVDCLGINGHEEGYLFRGTNLKELILPDSINRVDGSFIAEGCPNLKYVDTGNGIPVIGSMMFANNKSLEKVKIGTSVQEIVNGAFYNCPNLKEVYIPANVTYIYPTAFEKTGKNLVITGVPGSYAQRYAKSMGIKFKSKGKAVKEKTVALETPRVSGNTIYMNAKGVNGSPQGYDYYMSTPYGWYDGDIDLYIRADAIMRAIKDKKPGSTAAFHFTDPGTYRISCRGWTKDKKGKKQYTGWSGPVEVKVRAVTPETPKIKSVKVKGRTVTVEVQGKNAKGYDCVLGTGTKKSLLYYQSPLSNPKAIYQIKPAVYKYSVKNKSTTKLVFTNVKPGTYTLGLHSYQIYNNKKVFSPWSALKTVKVS